VAAVLILALLVLATSPSGATLLLYEPFDYDAGVLDGVAATGQNLAGTYAGSPVPPGFDLVVVSPGLGYGNLTGVPAASGNRLSQNLSTTSASASASIDADLATPDGQALFFSALFTLDDTSNANRFARITFSNAASGDQLSFGESVVGSGAITVSAMTATTGNPVAAGADNAFVDGHTVLLIGRYQGSAAPLGDRLELLVYDTADADLLPGGFDASDPGAEFAFLLDGVDIDLGALDTVTFTIRGQANNFLDELRVGTTYADVIPEPGTASLLALGLAGLAAAKRAR
jgi:hypothetical protein